jgi:hypothetical protein
VHFSRFVNYVVTIRLILVQSVTDILPDMDLSFAASLLSSPLSLSLLWPLLLGALLGGIGGLLGIGGGIIAIPVLAMGFGMEQQLAQGTALVMITPNVLIAFWRYRQRHHLPLRTAGLLGLATLLATCLPQRIVCLTTETVEVLYALGEQDRIAGISGYTVRPPRRARKNPRSSPSPAATSTRSSPCGRIWC